MTIQTPTRITIEIHPAGAGRDADVHVAAEAAAIRPQRIVVGEPREQIVGPAGYEPAACTCLDGDCGADHGNE